MAHFFRDAGPCIVSVPISPQELIVLRFRVTDDHHFTLGGGVCQPSGYAPLPSLHLPRIQTSLSLAVPRRLQPSPASRLRSQPVGTRPGPPRRHNGGK